MMNLSRNEKNGSKRSMMTPFLDDLFALLLVMSNLKKGKKEVKRSVQIIN